MRNEEGEGHLEILEDIPFGAKEVEDSGRGAVEGEQTGEEDGQDDDGHHDYHVYYLE